MSGPTPAERARQTARLLRSEGSAGVARRLLDRAVKRIPTPTYRQLAIDRADLLRAGEIAQAGWPSPAPLPYAPGEPLTVAWVCFAPTEGSGGHTTMFRMVSALERAGHRCIVYLRDDHCWTIDQHRRTIGTCWPAVRAEIRDLAEGIEDAHAIFATAWQTAYPVLASPARGVRLYFVQDYEPDFYAAGSEALLAEATFGFGFHAVTAGAWLAARLRRDYGIEADHFDFGCDLDRYHLVTSSGDAEDRTAVCSYWRPSAPRRAHELAVMALDLFAARHPEVDIHLFGEPARSLPFEVISHGILSPAELNKLYNRCAAGLVLSATNVSLVPHEMLAAGCVPVVNDAEHNRIVLDNPEVVYARATPFDLADALCSIVERPEAEHATAALKGAASVGQRSWDEAGAAVERVVREAVERRARASVALAA
ncbi:MAG: glycosyltransferase family 1 protein [Solirubrobacteraceae bacterium]